MDVKLLYITPINVVEIAARTCTNSYNKSKIEDVKSKKISNNVDIDFLKKLINMDHLSVFEHVFINWIIDDIPRYLLQEIARHRLSSLSVKSTRYTLTKLRKLMKKYMITKDSNIKDEIILYLKDNLYNIKNDSIIEKYFKLMEEINFESNDKMKPLLLESWKTSLLWSMNLREFMHIYKLRSDKSALYEFRILVEKMLDVLPINIKELVLYYKKNRR